ncbi:MAG TPA: AMMECR1 family protein [Bacillota bacterium]|nr:AMMECR1 domain-containing protein [Bacillota bacterium]HPZ12655.1 AMMECR1 family protein [Bacillota bacterium]
MRLFLSRKQHMFVLMVACIACVILAYAGVVGDNEMPASQGAADFISAVDMPAAGAWDVLSELNMVGVSNVEGPVIAIARECVALSVRGQPVPSATELIMSVSAIPEVEQALTRRSAGVFVTVVRNNSVRACVGSIWPRCANLAEEIAQSAREVAARDLRRPPIEPWELPTCEYAVSVVGRLERVSPDANWDPRAFGVFVRAGHRSGVILPGEALTHSKQLSWARDEAGIEPDEECEIYRFQTVKFGCSLDLGRGR